MNVKASGMEVLDSGTIIGLSDQRIEFDFSDSFKVRLEFKDAEGGKPGVVADSTKGTVTLILTNFNSSLGTGTIKPLDMGILNGRKVYLSFYVYGVRQNKIFHHTWYLGEAADG